MQTHSQRELMRAQLRAAADPSDGLRKSRVVFAAAGRGIESEFCDSPGGGKATASCILRERLGSEGMTDSFTEAILISREDGF